MIYFDNAATSYPKPECVYRAMDDFLRTKAGNPGRGAHRLALEADHVVDVTRNLLAKLFNCPEPKRVVFTQNTTDALNLALHGSLQLGDHVVTSSMEHNAVIRPLCALEEKGVGVTRVPCAEDGSLDPDAVIKAINPDTRLVVLAHASNVTGTIQPIEVVGKYTSQHGILFVVDAAQTAGVLPIDVQALNIDLLAFPGHKSLLGPPGTGGLIIGERANLRPIRQGGTGSYSQQERQPSDLPEGFESGTLNTVGIAGLGSSVRFLLDVGLDAFRSTEELVLGTLLNGLSQVEGLRMYGPSNIERQIGVISINLSHWEPMDIGVALDQDYGVAVRTGLHCAPCAHLTIGSHPTGTVRLSPGCFTTTDEANYVISAIDSLARGWQKGLPQIT
jgi:cysteine desulfurase / selenocysteine lyase